MILWTLVNDFINNPDKYDVKKRLSYEATEIQNKRKPLKEG